MNKKTISFLKYILLLLIAIGLLYFAFRKTDFSKMFNDIKSADYFWISMSVLVSLIAYLSRAYRWNMLIEPLGYKPKLKNTFFSLMVGYLANLALPRIGEISRCESLSQAENVPFNMLVGTVITERIIDLIMLGFALLLAALLQFDLIGEFILKQVVFPIKDNITNASQNPSFIFIGFVVILLISLLIMLFLRFKKLSFLNKVKSIALGLADGIRSVKNIRNFPLFIFHTLLIWVIYFFTTYFCFFSIPATSNLGVTAGVFAVSVGAIGMSAPVQGGFGTYHLMTATALTLFNIKYEDGQIFATIVHSSQTLFALFLGGISIFMLFVTNRKMKNEKSGENTI